MAALVLKKTVCTQLDRHTDMLSLGGRPPASAVFNVAWDITSGKISTLDMTVTVDAGGAGGRGPGCTYVPISGILNTPERPRKLRRRVDLTDM